MVTSCNH